MRCRFARHKMALAAMALCALMLTACSPTPDSAGKLAKTSMQKVLQADPRFAGTGVEVVEVQLLADGEKQYKGIARVKYHDAVYDVPVQVLIDGLTISWNTTPGAFSFIPENKPAR